MEELKQWCGADLATLIAVCELLGLVTFAVVRGEAWRGRLVIYMGDNTNVRSWLSRRAPRPKAARFVLRILTYVEIAFGFQILTGYARTYHNRTADLFSRSTAAEFELELRRLGLESVDVESGWRRAVESAVRARVPIFLGLHPDETDSALKLRTLRLARLEGASSSIHRGLWLCEVGRGLGDFAEVWLRLGGTGVLRVTSVSGSKAADGLGPVGADEREWIVAASVGPDASGAEGRDALDEAARRRAKRVIVEGPLHHPLELMKEWIELRGWMATWSTFRTTEFGETLHRRRWLLLPATADGTLSEARRAWTA
jgi:hypothetical protein